MSDPGLVERYGWRLGFPDQGPAVGLGEGRAPLVSAEALLEPYGYRGELYFHLEHGSPHGSYRDRGAALAVSSARRDGIRALVLRFADPRSVDVVRAYAARGSVELRESDDAELLAGELALDEESAMWRAGLSTSAWDVFDQLGGRPPEHHLCPLPELACALDEGYGRLRTEGAAAWVPHVETVSAIPTMRAHAALLRLGIAGSASRAAAVEAVLVALDAQRFAAPATVVLTLPE